MASYPNPVLEHMAKMRARVLAVHLGADHEMALVGMPSDGGVLNRFRETRPAAVRVEFVERAEQRLSGDDIDINAFFFMVPEFPGEGELGAVVLRVLKRSKPLS